MKKNSRHHFCNLNLRPTKALLLLLVTIISTLFASDIFAADFRSDTSTAFLSVLFGQVTDAYSTVIQGQKSLIGTVFQYFNGFVATVGAAMVFYITAISVMHSAHSGKPLGDKWHTMFLPMRVAAGAGMLLPNAYGYSYAQVITMWFILTGVNGADSVWDNVVNRLFVEGNTAITGGRLKGTTPPDYINKVTGQSEFINPDTNQIESGDFDTVNYLTPAIQFAVCVGTYGTTPPAADPTNATPKKACADQYPVCDIIPVDIGCSTSDCSGSDVVIQPSNQLVQKQCGAIDFNTIKLKGDIRTTYINNMLAVITTMANDVRKFFPDDLYYYQTKGVYDISANDYQDVVAKLQTVTDPVTSAAAYINAAVQDQRIADGLGAGPNYANKAKDIGWISAGSTYYAIIKSGESAGKDFKSISSYLVPPISSSASNTQQHLSADIIKQIGALRGTIKGVPSVNPDAALTTVKTNFEVTYHNKLLTILGLGIPALIEFIVHNVFNTHELLGYPDNVDVTNTDAIRNALAKDPLAGIASKGASITSLIETVLFGVVTAVILAGTLSIVLPGLPYFNAASGFLTIAFTLGFGAAAIGLVFYPVGIMMNIYIPLIPFIIYMTGVIGWLLLCIEAMAAAPIVALGLMHPSGDELLGSAETGLKLLLNLMLRPVLMVAGLVAGIVVLRVVLFFFSFSMIMLFGDSDFIPITSLGAVGAATYIFVGLLTVLTHKSFGLINDIPNKVMTWIGAQGSQVSGEGDYLQEAKGQSEKGGKMPSDIGAAGKSGGQAGKSFGSYLASKSKSSKPPTPGELE